MLLDLDDLGFLEDVRAANESLEVLAHLLGLDDLGFLEDVRAVGETLECLGHLLGLDDLGFLEDVRAVGETLERLGHLLGLFGKTPASIGETPGFHLHETLYLDLINRGACCREHRPQLIGDSLLSGGGDKELASARVVTGAVAMRADHVAWLGVWFVK
jgi:hypothetical protein